MFRLTAGTLLAPTLVALSLAALPAQADEVTDLLDSAREAYDAGDIQFALDDLEMARQRLVEMKTASLGAFLPDAPDGWTREVNTEMNTGLAMMGGGVGAEARYMSQDGEELKLTLMADNPMVASMSAMINNAGAMGMKTERIGRQRFAVQDGQMMALIGNRVLVQAEGDVETARGLLDKMDFEGMAVFGQ
ncbi:MAG: hypothetical protein ACU0CC_11890 [Sagittula sp.]|jgi:hypothetical protein|uniref:hypothetical protein n=1 Tax=unclassified Sagittula TaxID=2624628 RepID=UPI0024C2C7BD|nr:hypothetical protein [Sagittula sp. MA-2]WHZ35308.1 hypothetical protein QNI11_22135 [Sagittula sp. MA-2]